MQFEARKQSGVSPVLYIGNARSEVVARLREQGVRVIVAERVDRGLRLLKEFKVAAVVYDVPALMPVLDFVSLGSPVIVLAAGDGDWGDPGVRILKRETTASTLIAAIESLEARTRSRESRFSFLRP
jgi:hypothetical protein